jgi:hypothetical protein
MHDSNLMFANKAAKIVHPLKRVHPSIFFTLGRHGDDACHAFLCITAINKRVDNRPRLKAQGNAFRAPP